MKFVCRIKTKVEMYCVVFPGGNVAFYRKLLNRPRYNTLLDYLDRENDLHDGSSHCMLCTPDIR